MEQKKKILYGVIKQGKRRQTTAVLLSFSPSRIRTVLIGASPSLWVWVEVLGPCVMGLTVIFIFLLFPLFFLPFPFYFFLFYFIFFLFLIMLSGLGSQASGKPSCSSERNG